MSMETYMEKLKDDNLHIPFLENDKDKEAAYILSHKSRLNRTFKAIPETANKLKILDIGTTPFTFYIKEQNPNFDVWTVDRTDASRKWCANAGINLVVANLEDSLSPFEDGFFDVVIFCEVLEHLVAPHSEILADIRRILCPSGKLIISVPNIAHFSNRVKLLLGISPLQDTGVQFIRNWIHGHGHVHEYTRKEIIRTLESVGFKITKVEMLSRELSILSLKKRILCTFINLIPSFRLRIFIECESQ